MFTIGSIEWPKDASSAVHLYLNFLLLAFETLKINFSGYKHDPVQMTKLFLNGLISEDKREHALEAWWDYIDSREAVREFQDKNILMARLAICLLSVREKDANQLGEHLSWFLEVLSFFGMDTNKIIQMMETYFKSSAKCTAEQAHPLNTINLGWLAKTRLAIINIFSH